MTRADQVNARMTEAIATHAQKGGGGQRLGGGGVGGVEQRPKA